MKQLFQVLANCNMLLFRHSTFSFLSSSYTKTLTPPPPPPTTTTTTTTPHPPTPTPHPHPPPTAPPSPPPPTTTTTTTVHLVIWLLTDISLLVKARCYIVLMLKSLVSFAAALQLLMNSLNYYIYKFPLT